MLRNELFSQSLRFAADALLVKVENMIACFAAPALQRGCDSLWSNPDIDLACDSLRQFDRQQLIMLQKSSADYEKW